jgi:hypothetical protein
LMVNGLAGKSVGILNAAWAGNPVIKQPDSAAIAAARLDKLLGLEESGTVGLAKSLPCCPAPSEALVLLVVFMLNSSYDGRKICARHLSGTNGFIVNSALIS